MRRLANIENMKKLEKIDSRIIPITFLAFLLVLWQMVVDKGIIERYKLPSPTDIIAALYKNMPVIKLHATATLYEALLGLLIAILFSIFLGILMDNIGIIKKAIYPILIISQTVPIIALAPLFAAWFGFGRLPKVIVVVLVCFFPIVVSLLDGLESVDKDMLNLMRSMGASRLQIFRLVKFPASIASFFSGLRIAATYSIMGAIIGEWLGGSEGLGIYMLRVKHSFALDKFFGVIVVIVVLSMTLFKIISMLQHLLMPWAQELKHN